MTESDHSQQNNNNDNDLFFNSIENEEESQTDRQIEELQENLAAEKDARREERFFFILLSIILFNLAIMANVTNWAVPITITILELFLLLLIARRLGLEEVSTLFSRLIARIADGVAKQ